MPLKRQYDELLDHFQALPLLVEPDTLWLQVMEAGFLLRRQGGNGVGIPDLIIAIIARSHGVPVFSKDRHFIAMRDLIGIDLLDLNTL